MKEQALLKQKKYEMFRVMCLDKALEQYSTLKLLQKGLGDSRDLNKGNIEGTVISAEAEWSRHSHFLKRLSDY